MKYHRRFPAFLFLILFVFCAGSQKNNMPLSSPQDETPSLNAQLDKLTEQIILSLSQAKNSKIAVIEFSDLQGNTTEFGRYLAEELITRLYRTGEFSVIERSLLSKVLEEHKLNFSGIIDAASAKEIGKILGADAIATGTVTDLGQSVKINARLISAETGNVFSVASVEIVKDAAVRKLMNQKITAEASGQTAQSFSAQPGQRYAGGPKVLEKEGFRIELQNCTMSNRTVVCHLLITNTTEDDKEFEITFGWQYQTKIFDNFGNEYLISGIKFADTYKEIKGLSQYSGASKKIVAGTSVETELYFNKVSSKATQIALLQMLCGYRGFRAEFRDIPIIIKG